MAKQLKYVGDHMQPGDLIRITMTSNSFVLDARGERFGEWRETILKDTRGVVIDMTYKELFASYDLRGKHLWVKVLFNTRSMHGPRWIMADRLEVMS